MWLFSLIRGRCPHCQQGAIFNSFWHINSFCPHCQIKFEREYGYYSMAIFMGYLLCVPLIVLSLFLVWFLGAAEMWYYILPSALVVLLSPWIFRYGRISWLYVDEWLDPHQAQK